MTKQGFHYDFKQQMEIDMLPIRFGMEKPLDPKNSEKKVNFPFVVLKSNRCKV